MVTVSLASKRLIVKCVCTVPCLTGTFFAEQVLLCVPPVLMCVCSERWGVAVCEGEMCMVWNSASKGNSTQDDCKLGQLGMGQPTTP